MSGCCDECDTDLGVAKGDPGDDGASPVFSVGTVTTIPYGESAAVTITGTALAPILNFEIPQGAPASFSPVLYNGVVAAATGANTNLTVLDSYTIPAGTLVNNGDRIKGRAVYTQAANANAKTLTLRFATVTTSTFASSDATIIKIFFEFEIERISATTYQITTKTTTPSASITQLFSDNVATDWTGTFLIEACGTNGVATAGDINCQQLVIEYHAKLV